MDPRDKTTDEKSKKPEIYNEKKRRDDDYERSRDKRNYIKDNRDKPYDNRNYSKDNRDKPSDNRNYSKDSRYNQRKPYNRNNQYDEKIQKRHVWKNTKIEKPTIFIISQKCETHLEFENQIKKGQKEPTKKETKLAQLKNAITPIEKIWTSHIKQYLNDSEFVEIQRNNKSLAYGPIQYGKSIIKYAQKNNFKEHRYDNSISQSNIFSRAYFKLWQILSLNILDSVKDKPIKVGCVAEGPGGFIHSIIDYRLKTSPLIKDEFYSITLKIDKQHTRNAKDWSDYRSKQLFQSMREKGYTIKLSYGATGTGDLLREDNIDCFADHDLDGKKCFLVTGDGGIECIGDKQFDYQEVFNVKLFLGEMITAFKIQQTGGTFILKVYDCSFQLSRQLLTLLSAFYQSVKMVKPITSRPGNSEKYMLCEGFLGISPVQQKKLKQLLKQWTIIEPNLSYFENKEFVQSILKFQQQNKASQINKNLENANQHFLKQQQSKLQQGLQLAKDMDYDIDKIQKKLNQKRFKEQISYAYSWCKYYGIATIQVIEEEDQSIEQK